MPRLAVQAAELPALGRIDPVKAYPLALDFQRVAVDDGGGAGHVGKGRCREQCQGEQGAHRKSLTTAAPD